MGAALQGWRAEPPTDADEISIATRRSFGTLPCARTGTRSDPNPIAPGIRKRLYVRYFEANGDRP